jgi:hypothetical protein
MDELFENKHKRRVFLYIAFVTFLLLLLIRTFAVPAVFSSPTPKLVEILNVILDNLIASGVATIAIAGVIFYLNPPIVKKAEISVLAPLQISYVLQESRKETSLYWYSGGSGRFTRSVTIPELARAARARNQTTELVIQVIDPREGNLCDLYAHYRNRLRSASSKSLWTRKRVQIESYATIVSAYSHHNAQPLLKITVGLSRKYSLFRIDLSSTCALITKEDPQEPALTCKSGSLFYQSFLEDLRLSLEQAFVLPGSVCPNPEVLQPNHVSELLKKLGILDPNLVESDFVQIIDKVKNYENPYPGITR